MNRQKTIVRNKKHEKKPIHQVGCCETNVSEGCAPFQYEQHPKPKNRKCIPINPQGELLTPEKLCAFKGCGHYNDEEAMGVIESLTTLARIVVGTVLKDGMTIDNQQVLHLESNIKSNKNAA